MHIVHVEDFFHASAGYQINVLAKYMARLGHKVTIITSEMEKMPDYLTQFFGKDNIEETDKAYSEQYQVDIIRLPISRYLSGRAVYNQRQLDQLILDLQPDVLYIHGNDTLTGIRYARKIKKLNFPVIMDSHMLAMASKNRLSKYYNTFYRNFVTPALIKNKVKIIRTQDDPYVESVLGIPLSQAPWISTGSDLLLFHPDPEVKAKMRKKYNISQDVFVVIYTGKLTEEKGGKVLAETFAKEFATDRQITLVVVGNTSGEYGKEVEAIFESSENQIVRIPTQAYANLAQFYQMADLSVFPKQVSLSFYDAQAAGLPVVSESNNINDERVSHHNGLTYEENNNADFKKKITYFANLNAQDFSIYANNAHQYVKEHYNYDDIVTEYMDVIQAEYDAFHKGAE